MAPLAAVNALGVAVFGTVYGVAAARVLSQAAFVLALVLVFAAAVALWVRVEGAAGRGRDPIARLGRIAAALLVALLGMPALVLTPLFALQGQLPAEAGVDHVIARVMVVLLVALALTGLVNVAGALAIGGAALGRRGRGGGPRP